MSKDSHLCRWRGCRRVAAEESIAVRVADEATALCCCPDHAVLWLLWSQRAPSDGRTLLLQQVERLLSCY